MDKLEFFESCKELCQALDIDAPNKMTLRQYYETFSYLPVEKFKIIITHLKENHPKHTWPLMFDFKSAIRQKIRVNTYVEMNRTSAQGIETAKLMQKLKRQYPSSN